MGFLSNQKERAMRYEEDLEKKRQEFLSTRISGIEKIVFDIVGAYPDEGSVRFKYDFVDKEFYFEVDGVEFFCDSRYDSVQLQWYCNYCNEAVWSPLLTNPLEVFNQYKFYTNKDIICMDCQFRSKLVESYNNNNNRIVGDWLRKKSLLD